MKYSPLINSLNGGEVSPKIDARVDLQKYRNSCEVLENFIPLVEGGAMSRPGTYYVCEVKDSSKKVRLIPFQYSTVQAYIIEAGEYYFRFYKDEGQIVTTYANWGTGTYYARGSLVINGGLDYRCIEGHTSGTFATDLAAGNWAACSPTSGEVDLAYEIPSPYAESELFDLKIIQSADVLYIAHRSHNIKKLTRSAHTTWTLTNFTGTIDAAMTITGATKANPCVISATLGSGGANPTAGEIVYIDNVVGMTELNENFYTVGTVTTGPLTFQLSGVNSSSYSAYSSGGIATRAQFGTDGNNPGAIAFFEQRFMAGGTTNDPLKIWGSTSSDFENFKKDSADDSAALEYSLVSDKADAVNWLLGQEFLMVGTGGGVWRLGASSSSEPLTAANIVAKRQIASGVKDMDAEMISDSIIYVQRGGMTIRKATWEWTQDKYTALDLMRIAKHITKGETAALSGIVDMDYQSEPVPISWATRADGVLLGMVYEPNENIYPWFRIITDGEIESIAVITAEGEEDQPWIAVKRTIGTADKRYIEYFKPHDFFSVYEDAFFVDSGLTWIGDAAVEVTAISKAAQCTITATNSLANGNKVRFRNTGTWLDTHICTVSDRAAGSFKVKDENGSAYIDSTGFADYPPTTTTTTYDGEAMQIVAVANTNTCKIVCPNHGQETGTPVQIAGALGITDINGNWTISNTTDDTFEIALDATTLGTYTGSGVATPGTTVTAGNGTVEQVAKTVSGLSHLEGKSVAVLTDRGKHPARTVDSGAITLSYYANKITVGLPYDYNLQPLKIDAGSLDGSSRGKTKRIYGLSVGFYETGSAKWGPDEDNLKEIPFGDGGEPELFTGDKDTDFDGEYTTEATIYIQGQSPLPCTVLSIAPILEIPNG
jgi:hypothetical protein